MTRLFGYLAAYGISYTVVLLVFAVGNDGNGKNQNKTVAQDVTKALFIALATARARTRP